MDKTSQDTAAPGSQPIKTGKRELFCQEYVKDWNQTKAAIRAGYSEKTAYSQGNRMLKFVEVSQRIDFLVSQILSRHEIEQDDIVRELSAIGFSNILDYIEPIDREVVWTRGKGKNAHVATVFLSGVKLKDFEHIPPKVKRKIFSPVQAVRETQYGVEFRLYDKLGALDKLGQYFNMWKGEGDDGKGETPKSPEEMRKELGIE